MARIQTKNEPSALRLQIAGKRTDAFLDIEAWTSSEIKAISPLVDTLMPLIEWSHCVAGEEPEVELALREALNNAVVHGNGMDPRKLVHVRCRCELGKGVAVIVSDQGRGFDTNAVPDCLAVENLEAEHGRGIYLMKVAMDTVAFERGGTRVRMWKGRNTSPGTELQDNNESFPSAGRREQTC
jgi:serine/threonine-protein kinase RsbW